MQTDDQNIEVAIDQNKYDNNICLNIFYNIFIIGYNKYDTNICL